MGLKENVIIGKLIPARAEIDLPPRPVLEEGRPRYIAEGEEGYDPDLDDEDALDDDLDMEIDDEDEDDDETAARVTAALAALTNLGAAEDDDDDDEAVAEPADIAEADAAEDEA